MNVHQQEHIESMKQNARIIATGKAIIYAGEDEEIKQGRNETANK